MQSKLTLRYLVFIVLPLSGCTNASLNWKNISSSTTSTTTSTMNLVVPIEMLDSAASVSTAIITPFTRSQTTLNPSDYDGTVSYYFEVVAFNNGTSDSYVYLENSAGTVTYATINVVYGTSSVTRFRVPFSTVPTASGIFRVKLAAPATGSLNVYAARMIVQQTGATKTKLFIPLTNGMQTATGDTTAAFSASGSTTYPTGQATSNQTNWYKSSSAYSTSNGSISWTLEVVSSISGTSVNIALFDKDAGSIVSASETAAHSNNSATLQTVSFSDSALTAGHTYQIEAKTGITSYTYNIYRAGLWVSLTNMSAAEIYNRVYANDTLNGSAQAGNGRILLDSSLYSNPSFYLETGATPSVTSTIMIADCGANDSSTSCSAVASQSVNSTSYRVRSTSSFNVTNGDRYILGYSASGTMPHTVTFVVASIQK